MFKKVISTAMVMVLVHNIGAQAGDTGVKLEKLWKSVGAKASVTEPGYYQGQQRGYFSGGTIYFGREKKNRPLLTVNMPEFKMGGSCYNQGVLNFGGISMINSEELKAKLTNIGQQAGMMMIYMGLTALSPIISENLQEVYSKLQELSGFLSDECQAASQLVGMVGGYASQHSEIAKKIFSDSNTQKGKHGGLGDSYKNYPKGKNETLNDVANNNPRKALQNINLAWQSLQYLKDSTNNTNTLKEMLMTLSGTIIIKEGKNDGDAPEVKFIESRITSPEILRGFLKGGNGAKIIKCDEYKKCLNVAEKNTQITEDEQAFEKRVAKYFDEITKALEEDRVVSHEVQNFLSKSGMPVYKMQDVLFRATQGSPKFEEGVLVQIVAWRILYNYLSDMLAEVNEVANNLQIADAESLKSFKEGLRNARKQLEALGSEDLERHQLQAHYTRYLNDMDKALQEDTLKAIG